MQFRQCTTTLSAAFAALMTLSHSVTAAQFQNRGQAQWQKYHDTKFRLSLDYPPGWAVHVDAHSILVSNPDKSTFALIENFTSPRDDTPEDYVDSLPATESRFFPECHVDQAFTEPAKSGDEKEESGVGTLSFAGARGPARARVLTRIYSSGGILFAVAAPGQQFGAASPVLVRILQSVNFGAGASGAAASTPVNDGNSGSNVGKELAAAVAPIGLDSLSANVKYKHWVDPKEGAFSYDVPVGWKVDGGSYRYAPLDVRQSIIVRSPHDEMAILLGDASIPMFTLPSPGWTRIGYRDGAVQNVVGKPMFFMHYMSAAEFNQWYFDNILTQNIDNLEVGETKDNPDAANQMMEAARHDPNLHGQVVDSVAGTAFSGRSKLNGRSVSGILFTITSEFIGDAQGSGNWTAHPQIAVYASGDGKADARKDFLAAVKKHVNGSFQFSTQWIAAQNLRATKFLAANQAATNAALAMGRENMASMARSHQTYMSAQDNRRTSMMGSFKAQMAAKDDTTRKMQNYSLDQTDVRDSSGQSWKVPSGYTNYYHNGRAGVVVGTNSPSNPGGDFSALTQY